MLPRVKNVMVKTFADMARSPSPTTRGESNAIVCGDKYQLLAVE